MYPRRCSRFEASEAPEQFQRIAAQTETLARLGLNRFALEALPEVARFLQAMVSESARALAALFDTTVSV